MRSIRAFVVFGGFIAALVMATAPTASAQKNKKDDDAKYIARIRDLEGDLKRLQAAFKADEAKDKAVIQKLQQTINNLESKLKKEDKANDKDEAALKAALAKYKNADVIHSIILRAKNAPNDAEVKAVVKEVHTLLDKAPGVLSYWVGRPAVGAQGFNIGIIVLFDDQNGLKKFEADGKVKSFLQKLNKNWEKPDVYDVRRE